MDHLWPASAQLHYRLIKWNNFGSHRSLLLEAQLFSVPLLFQSCRCCKVSYPETFTLQNIAHAAISIWAKTHSRMVPGHVHYDFISRHMLDFIVLMGLMLLATNCATELDVAGRWPKQTTLYLCIFSIPVKLFYYWHACSYNVSSLILFFFVILLVIFSEMEKCRAESKSTAARPEWVYPNKFWSSMPGWQCLFLVLF